MVDDIFDNRIEPEYIRLINWHYASNTTIDLKDSSIFLTGSNGAGKSTLTDALKIILMLNTNGLNRAASTGKTRDIKSYVRCRINDENSTYLYRPNESVSSYIAVQFLNRKEKCHFVVGVNYYSASETAEIETQWFTANNTTLSDIDFLEKRQDGTFLVKRARNIKNRITTYATIADAKCAVASYYGLSSVFKKEDLSTFNRFTHIIEQSMNFNPSALTNVSKFIADDVCQDRPLNIEDMRENLYELDAAKRKVQAINRNVQASKEIKMLADEYKTIEDEKKHNVALKVLANYQIKKATIKAQEEKLLCTQNTYDSNKENETTLKQEFDRKGQIYFQLKQNDKLAALAKKQEEISAAEAQLSDCETYVAVLEKNKER